MVFTHSRLGLFGLLLNILFGLSLAIFFPALNDTPPVGVRTMAFTDETRIDYFAPTPKYREVVVSLFYPMEIRNDKDEGQIRPTTNYMPNATATFYDALLMALGLPSGVIERISTYSQTDGPFFTTGEKSLPLLVFSPGFGQTFHGYTSILQEVARKGYVVAAIDHPYDAEIVEFPDGTTVQGANLSASHTFTEILMPRLRDVSFVLNELSQPATSHPFPLDTRHVVAFGHSLGGDTAIEVMLQDSRVKGGVNFDGNFNGKLQSSGVSISRPVLLLRTKDFSSGLNWNDAWEKFAGWKIELAVSDTTHNSFSDLPLLADILGIRSVLGRMGSSSFGDLGPLGGLQGVNIMSSYVTTFAEFVFTGKDSANLKCEGGGKFSEVHLVRRDGPCRYW
ncbi:hypothetical protein MMC22_010471 [Lobaria immixta]|nr:hypothetical protein [Lobaria immixta]